MQRHQAYMDPYKRIREDLISGERLLWTGQSAQGVIFRKQDIFLIPFSIIWAGPVLYAGLFEVPTDNLNQTSFIMIIMMCAGIYLLFGRFIYDVWKRKRTYFGLTRERLIIQFGNSLSSIALDKDLDITFTEDKYSCGTIELVHSFERNKGRRISKTITLDKIENGRMVYDMIKKNIYDSDGYR